MIEQVVDTEPPPAEMETFPRKWGQTPFLPFL